MEFRQARPQKPDQRRQTKIWLVRFALIAGFIFLVKLFTFISGRPNPVDNAITAVGTPVVNVVKRIGEGIGGLVHVFRLPTLLKENSRLESENAELKRKLEENLHLQNEVAELQKQLGIRPAKGFKLVHASVTSRPYDLWLETALVNAGSRDGVAVGDLVVNSEGVVGKVVDVRRSSSRIQLISSPEFRLGAIAGAQDIVKESRAEGVVRGIDQRSMEMLYVKAGTPVEIGQKVYTRGNISYEGFQNLSLQDENRPRGIFIGTITEKKVEQSSRLGLVLEPAADVNRLGSVAIYTSEHGE
ncbi:MAG: rod shape-determining protein MreC [Planctomycetales bacterium]|nr:rod shape-determining protein MreC [bacterium]UNM08355.1 MAG: rod shape-determining protein MreC [Planctomycetales bacterium]